MVLVVNNCCFCIDLRTGSLMIGYFNVIANLTTFVFGIMGLINIANTNAKNEFENETGRKVSVPLIFLGLGLILMNLAFLGMFFYGMYKYHRKFVYVYIIYSLVSIVLASVMVLVGFISGRKFLKVLGEACNVVLNIYFLLVIRSYYLIMGTTPQGPTMYNSGQQDAVTLPMQVEAPMRGLASLTARDRTQMERNTGWSPPPAIGNTARGNITPSPTTVSSDNRSNTSRPPSPPR